MAKSDESILLMFSQISYYFILKPSSKSTLKTLEKGVKYVQSLRCCSVGQTLNMSLAFPNVSIIDFERLIVCWKILINSVLP